MPMRRSAPTAWRTRSTSAPNSSQTFAISFMNEIRVASSAFAAYLRQLGARAIHHHDRRAGARERLVQRHHHLGAARVLGADHDAIGLHEILDRGALLQEFGVADDAERVRRLAPDDRPDLLGGADRDGALVDDDLVAVHRPADVLRDPEHVLQIGRSVLALRRADRDEHDLRGFDRACQLRREGQPPFVLVAS